MSETAMSHSMVVHKGTGTIYLAEQEVIDADTQWIEYHKTLKDSASITQTAPDKTFINIDQATAPIATTLGEGSFEIAYTVPDVAPEVLGLFFNTSVSTFAPSGKSGVNVSTELKVVSKMFRMDFDDRGAFIAPNCELNAVLEKTADGTFNINVTGSVLAHKGVGFEQAEVIFWKKD